MFDFLPFKIIRKKAKCQINMKSISLNETEIPSNQKKTFKLFNKMTQFKKNLNKELFFPKQNNVELKNQALQQQVFQSELKTSHKNSYENIDTLNLKTDEDLEFLAEKQDSQQVQLCPDSPDNSISEETLQLKFFTQLDEYNYQFKLDFEKKHNFSLSNEQLQISVFSKNKSYRCPSCYLKPYPQFKAIQFQQIKYFREYNPNQTSQNFIFSFQFTQLMRAQVIDWLMEVCRDFNLTKSTFSLCVDYMDRFLANTSENNLNFQILEKNNELYLITKEDLQLIAAGCLFIASKIEVLFSKFLIFQKEIHEINIAYLQSATAFSYTQDQIINTEIALLKNLQFKLNSQTLNTWLDFTIFYWDLFLANVKETAKNLQITNCLLYELQNQTIRKNCNLSNFRQLSLALNYLHFDFNSYKNQELEVCTATLFIFIFHLLQITDEEFEFSLIKSFAKFINPAGNNFIIQVTAIIQKLSLQLAQIFKHNLSISSSPSNINLLLSIEVNFCQIINQTQPEQQEVYVLQDYYPKLLQFFTENDL